MIHKGVSLYTNWLSVDLDGTILEFPPDLDHLGDPKPGAKEALSTLRSIGYKICIHTSRPIEQFELILNYLCDHEIPYDALNEDCAPFRCTKPLSDLYIDDRAFEFRDWSSDFKRIILRLKDQGLEKSKVTIAFERFMESIKGKRYL